MEEDKSKDGHIFNILKFKQRKHSKFMEKFMKQQQQGDTSNNYKLLNREDGPSSQPKNFTNIQLQCLDAHSLLLSSRSGVPGFRPDLYVSLNSSPGGSSLDLEWEHEYATNNRHNPWTSLPENGAMEELSSDEEHTSSSGNSNRKQPNQKSCKNIRVSSRFNGSKNRSIHSATNTWSHISTPESLEWDQDDDQDLKSEDSLDQETRDLLFQIEQLKNRVLNETGHFEYGSNDVES